MIRLLRLHVSSDRLCIHRRYWAITDPFNYPTKMSDSRAAALILTVWLCSATISFPAIAWWRLTAEGNNNTQYIENAHYTCELK